MSYSVRDTPRYRLLMKMKLPLSIGMSQKKPCRQRLTINNRIPQFSVIIPSISDIFTTLYSVIKHETTANSKIIVFGITANMVALYAKLFENLVDLKVYQL